MLLKLEFLNKEIDAGLFISENERLFKRGGMWSLNKHLFYDDRV